MYEIIDVNVHSMLGYQVSTTPINVTNIQTVLSLPSHRRRAPTELRLRICFERGVLHKQQVALTSYAAQQRGHAAVMFAWTFQSSSFLDCRTDILAKKTYQTQHGTTLDSSRVRMSAQNGSPRLEHSEDEEDGSAVQALGS